MVVRGRVVFEQLAGPVAGAVLTVRLVDVSRADASSITKAESVFRDVALTSSTDAVAFELSSLDVRSPGRYAVEAHLDVDGSGDITPGDYLTMESFPVDPALTEATVEARLRYVAA